MKRFWISLGLAVLYAGGYMLLIWLCSLAVGLGFSLWLTPAGAPGSEEALQEAYAAWIASAYHYINLGTNALAALCIGGVCALRRRKPGLDFFRLEGRIWLLCAALGAVAAVAILIIMGFLPRSWLEDYAKESAILEQGPWLVRLLAIAVAAPLVEEMLFRGLVYGALREGMSRPLAVALCALSFGAMHGHPVWIAYAALLGLALCLIRDACGSLWGPVAFHMSFNLVGSFLLAQWRIQAIQALVILPVALAVCLSLSSRLGLGRERKGG